MPETDDDKPVTQRVFNTAFQTLTGRIGQVETKINHLEDRMNDGFRRLRQDMDERFREMLREMNGRFDAFVDKIETYGRETVTIPKTLDHHGKRLDDHENRIRSLES
jgi:hypothetical protein